MKKEHLDAEKTAKKTEKRMDEAQEKTPDDGTNNGQPRPEQTQGN